MAEKIHVGKNGPGKCEAKEKVCPLGESNHYSTFAEADRAFAERMESENSMTVSLDRSLSPSDVIVYPTGDEIRAEASERVHPSLDRDLDKASAEASQELIWAIGSGDYGYEAPTKDENDRVFGDVPSSVKNHESLMRLSDDLEDRELEVEHDWADDDRNVLRSITVKQINLEIENRDVDSDLEGFEPNDDEHEARRYYYG